MPSSRITNRDYSLAGFYFVTICADYKRCIFGKVKGKRVQLSALGRIAHESWINIPYHFSRVNLHELVVMPNHVHRILEITAGLAQHAGPLHKRETSAAKGPPPQSLSTIVRSYKADVTRRAHAEPNWKGEVWQHNYFDRVIRDAREFLNATRYIAENPLKWEWDRENLRATKTARERLAQHAAPLQRVTF